MWFRKHHSGDQCNLTHSNLDLIHLPLEWQMHYAPGEEKDFLEINLELDGLINVAFGTMHPEKKKTFQRSIWSWMV